MRVEAILFGIIIGVLAGAGFVAVFTADYGMAGNGMPMVAGVLLGGAVGATLGYLVSRDDRADDRRDPPVTAGRNR